MVYHAGDECIRSYVLVYSQRFSESILYNDEDTHHHATVIRSNLVRYYDKRDCSAGSYPRKGQEQESRLHYPQ